jgi:hypothetical protein
MRIWPGQPVYASDIVRQKALQVKELFMGPIRSAWYNPLQPQYFLKDTASLSRIDAFILSWI